MLPIHHLLLRSTPIQVAIVHVNSFPSHDLFPEAAVPRAVKVGLVVNTNMFF